jgi:hypothetical protein
MRRRDRSAGGSPLASPTRRGGSRPEGSPIKIVLPRAATKACAAACHGCRRRAGSGESGRNGTSARWSAPAAAAHRRPDRFRGGRHHRTTPGGSGRSCRAGAPQLAVPAARDQAWDLWVQASPITPPHQVPDRTCVNPLILSHNRSCILGSSKPWVRIRLRWLIPLLRAASVTVSMSGCKSGSPPFR